MAKHGKRFHKVREALDRDRFYSIDEAVKLIKENAKSKFDETIEIAMNLGVDPRHADQMVRGVVTLPNGTGRTLRVGVFARGAKADEARAKIRESLQGAKARLLAAEQSAVKHGEEAVAATEARIKENPWQAVGIAAGVGLVIGVLLARR